MHRWNPATRKVRVSFFFHYRGTAIQKSFEGLLRRIVSQLLAAEPELLPILRSYLSSEYTQKAQQLRLGSLRADIYHLMETAGISGGTYLRSIIDDIVQSQDAISAFRKALISFREEHLGRRQFDLEGVDLIELELPRRRDELLRQKKVPKITDFLSCRCWDHTKLSDVRKTLVSKWLTELDLDQKLCELLKSHGVQEAEMEPNETRQGPDEVERELGGAEQEPEGVDRTPTIIFPARIEIALRDLLRNQNRRNRLRIDIQDREWPRDRLEHALQLICGQNIFALDLCLFLDGLDEYDGRPEFMSQFLHDLADENAFPRTKIRVLFSSRPWAIFQEEFARCTGFQVQDFTQDDIRNYCITTIPNNVKAICNFKQLMTILCHDQAEYFSG